MTTKAELLAIAEKHGVEVDDTFTKAEIEDALDEAGVSVDEATAEEEAEASVFDENESNLDVDNREVKPEVGGADVEAEANARNIAADLTNVEAAKQAEAEALAATDVSALDAQIAQHEAELERLRAAKEGA